jgi:hypothetical protein
MSLMKMDPGADSETYLTYSHNINELPDIKEEKEEAPLMITFPVIKGEDKVSCYI